LISALAPYVRLRPLRGQQAEALKLFTSTPRPQIQLDLRPRPVTSSGCGIAMPFGLPSRIETRGILWGIDLATGNPVFYDGWAAAHGEGGRPFHATFFGFTGYGKTFAMQTLLYRLALTGTQVIVIEPMGHFARLARALGGGASYNPIAFEKSAMNVLDNVQPTVTDQISHVKRQLALLLSCESGAATRESEQGRRVFSNDESAALDSALGALYRPVWGEALPAALTPRLEDLCDRLDGLDTPAGHKIAGEVRQTYVTGMKAGSFNRPTNLDLRFDRPCTVFDVTRIDEDYLPLYYMQLTTVLNRYIRNPARTRPLVIAIDEFRYMAQDPVLAHAATTLVKTARTFHTAVWTADQNPGTYMQNEDGRQMVALSPLVFIGRQQAKDLELHRHLFQRLTAQHLQQIATARRGQFVTMMGDDYYFLQIEPSPVELVAFRGT
jgi:type IV secretory pathway VirB4 component